MCRREGFQQRQAGFGLPVVVFILVIMSLLAAAMLRISTTGAIGSASETQSIRAFYAAESGAQWGMSQLFPLNGALPGCFGNTTLNGLSSGLAGCSATVSCLSATANTGSGTITHYTITSTGTCGNEVRQIQVGAKTL